MRRFALWLAVDIILLAVVLLIFVGDAGPQQQPEVRTALPPAPEGFTPLPEYMPSTTCRVCPVIQDGCGQPPEKRILGGYVASCTTHVWTHRRGKERFGKTLFDGELPLARPASKKEAWQAVMHFVLETESELLKKAGLYVPKKDKK